MKTIKLTINIFVFLTFSLLSTIPLFAQLHAPEVKVLNTTNNNIVLGGSFSGSIIDVQGDLHMNHNTLEWKGSTGSENRIYYAPQSGWDDWRIQSNLDNLVLSAGTDDSGGTGNGRWMIFKTSNIDRMRIRYDNGNIGINTSPLFSSAKLQVGGSVSGTQWITTSDKKLKKNIKQYHDGLNIVQNINPVEFQYNDVYYKDPQLQETKQIGVIAQELQKIAPYLVGEMTTDEGETYLTINNTALDFLLINAIKDQQALIEHQQTLIEELQQSIQNLEQKK